MFTFDILSSVCSFGHRDASKNKTTQQERESHASQKTRENLAFPRPSGHFRSLRRLGRVGKEGGDWKGEERTEGREGTTGNVGEEMANIGGE